jgi:hypothetical protein
VAGSSSLTLLASTGINSSGNSGTTPATGAVGGNQRSLFIDVNLSAVPTGGAPTLDVYLQTSADGGTTWRDMAHTQFTTSALHRFFQVSEYASGSTSTLAASDGQLAGETVIQGPFGGELRLKWVFAAGGSSGSYTLAAIIIAR